jgi:hypothetical protein
VVGRRASRAAPEPAPEPEAAKAGGKGRPTPKRSEARKKTPYTPVAKSRKESYRRDKGEVKTARQRQLDALKAGDDRHLPAFAAGPERALVRDVVDARPSLVSFVFIVLTLSVFAGVVQSLPLAVRVVLFYLPLLSIIIVITEIVRTGFAVRRALNAAYPDGTEIPRGKLVRYGAARAMQFRRMRLPPPRVSRRGPIRGKA